MKLSQHQILFFLAITYCLTGCTAAVIGGAAVGTSVVLDKRTSENYFADQEIKRKFTYAYSLDEELSKQTQISFTSYNRQALITGQAPNELQKQQLEKISKQIKSVRHTFNEVVVAPSTSLSSRSNDAYITSKIKTSLLTHLNEFDNAQCKVVTENSTVFLMGLVTHKQADQITEIVRTTDGVKRVVKIFEYVKAQEKKE